MLRVFIHNARAHAVYRGTVISSVLQHDTATQKGHNKYSVSRGMLMLSKKRDVRARYSQILSQTALNVVVERTLEFCELEDRHLVLSDTLHHQIRGHEIGGWCW
jgi:hypothetical protein